jgi:hypothetical protein
MNRPGVLHRRSVVLGVGAAGAAAAAVGNVLMSGRRAHATASMNAAEVKTAMIGKIAEFVRWPAAQGMDDRYRAFEFVVLGETPLESFFVRYYKDQEVRIAGHNVYLRRARTVAEIGRPHLLFVSGTYEDKLAEVLYALGRAPTLTVADTEGFAHRGIAVNLYLSGDQVRFEISRRALERHGLTASYRLYGLAKLIEDQQARR